MFDRNSDDEGIPLLDLADNNNVEEVSDSEIENQEPADAAHQKIVRNVGRRFKNYLSLVKYYESQINIAKEQANASQVDKVLLACQQLEHQLAIYLPELKTKIKKPSIFLPLSKKLDNLYHESERQDLTALKESLDKLNTILNKPLHKKLRVRIFSDESLVIKKDELEKKRDEFLAKGAVNANPQQAVGNLNDGGSQPIDPSTSTQDFLHEARINRISLSNQGYQVNIVSVQQQYDKGAYTSFIYINGPIDLSRQLYFGYTLPNDSLLKIAIAEVENWRAGKYDLSSNPRIHIAGNFPKELVEAFVLYCEHKGYSYSNETIHKIELNFLQKNGYNKQLNANPDNYLIRNKDENLALLARGSEVEECIVNTQLDVDAINEKVKESEEKAKAKSGNLSPRF